MFLRCLDELSETIGWVLGISDATVFQFAKNSKCMLQILLCCQKLFIQLTKSVSKNKMLYQKRKRQKHRRKNLFLNTLDCLVLITFLSFTSRHRFLSSSLPLKCSPCVTHPPLAWLQSPQVNNDVLLLRNGEW